MLQVIGMQISQVFQLRGSSVGKDANSLGIMLRAETLVNLKRFTIIVETTNDPGWLENLVMLLHLLLPVSLAVRGRLLPVLLAVMSELRLVRGIRWLYLLWNWFKSYGTWWRNLDNPDQQRTLVT